MLSKVYCSKCGRRYEDVERNGKELSFVCAKCGTRHDVKVLDRDEMSEKCPDSE